MTFVEPVEAGESRAVPAARDNHLLLELSRVSKRFPGVVALDRVDFDLRHGEVHVLFGENGAGKSTLINIIAGTYPPDEGLFTLQGETISRLTPHAARLLGISPVFQEFSLVPELTVEQNLFLGRELTRGGVLDRAAMRAKALEVIKLLAFDLDPNRKVRVLSRAHQQMVEIAKAFLADVRLLILDEPTASLTEAEAEKLFDLVAKLKESGVGIIYVSHRMREIKQIADRITVLRDGRKITTVNAADVSENDLVELMTGRKIDVLFPHIERAVANFSGGNRQKVLLARGLTRDISIYLFDEPTVGIDVGAKTEVYELMKEIVATGAAIVLVSSELSEVLHLSHRLYVMHRSRVVAELAGADINEQRVLSHFFREHAAEPASQSSRDQSER